MAFMLWAIVFSLVAYILYRIFAILFFLGVEAMMGVSIWRLFVIAIVLSLVCGLVLSIIFGGF